jgi:hypothetical protein
MSLFRLVKDLIIGVVIVFGGIYLFIAIGSRSLPATTSVAGSEVSSVAIGSEGQLSSGGPVIPVAIDEERIGDLKRTPAKQDLSELGPVFFVSEATPVRVSESSATGLRVRILSGPQKGRSGWVPFEWVKPLKI